MRPSICLELAALQNTLGEALTVLHRVETDVRRAPVVQADMQLQTSPLETPRVPARAAASAANDLRGASGLGNAIGFAAGPPLQTLPESSPVPLGPALPAQVWQLTVSGGGPPPVSWSLPQTEAPAALSYQRMAAPDAAAGMPGRPCHFRQMEAFHRKIQKVLAEDPPHR